MLKLVRRPNSPYWIVRGSVAGIRLEESTGTADKRLAEEIRAAREAGIHKKKIYGRAATATFAEAALSYLEGGGSKRFLLPIIDHFGTTPLAKIELAAIERAAACTLSGRLTIDTEPMCLHADCCGTQTRCQARHVSVTDHRKTEVAEGAGPLADT